MPEPSGRQPDDFFFTLAAKVFECRKLLRLPDERGLPLKPDDASFKSTDHATLHLMKSGLGMRLITLAAFLIIVGGCKEVLPKTDFAKFAECVQKASENDIVSKSAAKTACSDKYSKFKDIDITGSGGFSYCLKDEPCSNFEINIRHPFQKSEPGYRGGVASISGPSSRGIPAWSHR